VKNIRSALSTIVVLVLSIIQVAEAKPKEKFALVIHGGAGTILKKNMTAEREAAYRAKLDEALQTGYKILNTGGMTNKRWGRVGDVPIIGAGTYANNETCAVSATGTGEYFIRAAAAHDISALMEYKHYSLIKASKKVIQKVGKLGGSGGVICIDAKGNIAMPFNTKGMYRGYIKSDGKAVTLIYKKD
jgi:beta-aspartyl-peptidase (threonine type)